MTQKSDKGSYSSYGRSRTGGRAVGAADGRTPKRPWDGRGVVRHQVQPKAIKELLNSTLARFGIGEQVARYQFVLDWEKIVGPKIASCSRPHSLERGILVIRVLNSEWAQELVFQKDLLLSRLARYASESGDSETGRVTDIRFVVGPRGNAAT